MLRSLSHRRPPRPRPDYHSIQPFNRTLLRSSSSLEVYSAPVIIIIIIIGQVNVANYVKCIIKGHKGCHEGCEACNEIRRSEVEAWKDLHASDRGDLKVLLGRVLNDFYSFCT